MREQLRKNPSQSTVWQHDLSEHGIVRENHLLASSSEVIKEIHSVLSPDLLKPEYRKVAGQSPLYGHCYAATEALYHLLGGKSAGLTPQRARDVHGVTHWWLKTAAGEILDPTVEQYTFRGEEPPYEKGVGSGFLTREPSKRAREIIRRVEERGPCLG